MLLKSAVVAGLATSFLLGEVLVGGAVTQPAAVAPQPAAAAAPLPEPAAPAAAGVSGKVLFRGTVPTPTRIDMASDSFCVGAHPEGALDQRVVVDGAGGLANVFVSLTGVPDVKHKAPETPVVLDQKGCTYFPHVFGVLAKQEIEILNSDTTLHNIHAVPKKNKEFNVGMPDQGMKIRRDFKKEEDAILIKCDVHPWMAAWCFSMAHPYFGVTAVDGSVTIPTPELPDGEYGVRIWHETLGEATAKVKVAGGAASFEHAFK